MAIHFCPNVIFASKALSQCYKHFLDRSQCHGVLQCAGFHAVCRLSCNMQNSLQHAGQASLQRAGFHAVCRFPCSMQVSMQRACTDNHMQVSMQCAVFLATCRLPYSMKASLQRACRDISVAGFHAMQVSTQWVCRNIFVAGFHAVCRLSYSLFLTACRLPSSEYAGISMFHAVCRFPCSVQASLQLAGFLATYKLSYSVQAFLLRACRDIYVEGVTLVLPSRLFMFNKYWRILASS